MRSTINHAKERLNDRTLTQRFGPNCFGKELCGESDLIHSNLFPGECVRNLILSAMSGILMVLGD